MLEADIAVRRIFGVWENALLPASLGVEARAVSPSLVRVSEGLFRRGVSGADVRRLFETLGLFDADAAEGFLESISPEALLWPLLDATLILLHILWESGEATGFHTFLVTGAFAWASCFFMLSTREPAPDSFLLALFNVFCIL